MKFLVQILLITFFIFFNFKNYNYKNNHSLNYYFSHLICKFLVFNDSFNCPILIFKNKNFYDNIKENRTKFKLMINIKKTKIENILLLIGIVPFLNKKSIITFKINEKNLFFLLKNIFKDRTLNNRIVEISKNDFHYFIDNFNELVNYNWELIPNNNLINNIRYILNKYYNQFCRDIFDKSLNNNFKNYIHKINNKLSFEKLEDLLSK